MPDYWEPTGPIILSAPAPHTSTFETDPAAGVVRPYLWGDELNVRATIAGSGGESFTFGVTAEGQA